MLGLQRPSADTGHLQNIRCGDVYYKGSDTYHVNCLLCEQNILYELFPQHFLWHLAQEEEFKLFNKNGKLVKRGQVPDAFAKAEEDPIGNHESNGEIVDLAEIAKLDIEIYGTVASVESEEDREENTLAVLKLKETRQNRNAKPSTTAQKNDDKFKEEESLQEPLLRESRKRSNIGSRTSRNVTQSTKPNIGQQSPTDQHSIKSSLNSFSENIVNRVFSTQPQTTENKNPKQQPSKARRSLKTAAGSSTNEAEVLKSKISSQKAEERSCDKPDEAPTQDPFAGNIANPETSPILRVRKRLQPIEATSTNDIQTTKSKIAKPTLSGRHSPLSENEDGHESSTSDPFADSDDRCESPDWLPEVDEKKNEEKNNMRRSFPCDKCDRCYLSKRALGNHKKDKHEKDESKSGHPCVFCNRSFASVSSKYRHIRMKHKTEINNETPPKSKGINDSVDDEGNGTKPKSDDQTKADEKSNPCKFCGQKFESNKDMKIHLGITHQVELEKLGEKWHKCCDCDMMFQTERELRHHRVTHTGRIECDICGKPLKNLNNLDSHLLRHSNVRPYECDACDRSFYNKHELVKHKIRHTGIMPIICEVCGKPCRDRGVYKAHMRRHTGERPAKCDVCGKCFYSIYDLNVHAVAHTTARPFICNVCGSTFQRKKALRVHKLLHSDTRKHDCKICGKKFAQSSGLNTHLRTHDAAASRNAITNVQNEVNSLNHNKGHGEFGIRNFEISDIGSTHE